MARRPGGRRVEEAVFFDVLYEDGSQTSNRRVPSAELDSSIKDDQAAKIYLEEQDRKIAGMSGKPRGPIKSMTRANRR